MRRHHHKRAIPDPIESFMSIQSVFIVSKESVISVSVESTASVASVAAQSPTAQPVPPPRLPPPPPPSPSPTPTPTPTPTPPRTTSLPPTSTSLPSPPPPHIASPSSVDKPKPKTTASHKATPSPSHKAVASSNSGHANAGLIAGMIVLVCIVAGAVAFFVLRYKSKKNARQKSGLWLESPGYLNALGKDGGAGASKEDLATPTPYVFDGGIGNDVGNSSYAPPPLPPAKEELEEKSMEPNLMDSYSSSTALLSPPQSAFSPRPRSPDVPKDTYAQVQDILASAQASRPDSGPMILYSTPKQEENIFGTQQQQEALSRSLSSASARSVQRAGGDAPLSPLNMSLGPGASAPGNTSGFAPPMPVNVPSPILPPSSNDPSQTPRLILSPTPSQQQSLADPATGAVGAVGALGMPRPFSAATTATDAPAPSVTSSRLTQTRKIYPVIRTYNPTLLDELRIQIGEFVAVVNEFDDGWGFCEKVGDPDGAAGVVPLECLDRTNGPVQLPESGPPAYTPAYGANGLLNPSPLKPGFAPTSVGHTSASPSVTSAGTGVASGPSGNDAVRMSTATASSAADAQSQAAAGQNGTADSHRISARFSSFHVDFDAIRASGA